MFSEAAAQARDRLDRLWWFVWSVMLVDAAKVSRVMRRRRSDGDAGCQCNRVQDTKLQKAEGKRDELATGFLPRLVPALFDF